MDKRVGKYAKLYYSALTGMDFSDAEAMKDRQLKRHVKFTRYSDLSDGECCHDVIERR